MKIYTENSIYEINTEEKLCRRIPLSEAISLRKDKEWAKYITLHYTVGEPMRLVLEHLGSEEPSVTLRTTSTVVRIEE